jgi:hypothetical protein
MNILFHGTVGKDSENISYNEDAYEFSIEENRIAISDGATNSFDSKSWANIIVNKFVSNPKLNKSWIIEAIREYNLLHNYSALSWSKQAAFERGSFASLIGIELLENQLIVTSFGDSIAILLDGDRYIDSFPYIISEDFNKDPELLASFLKYNTFFEKDIDLSKYQKNWYTSNYTKPILVCMTDAFGQWALKNEEKNVSKWDLICNIKTQEQLLTLVENERLSKEMKLDDTTLLIIDLSGDNK